MATHSSVLAWRIPGTGEPGGLPSMGLHRVRHDCSALEQQQQHTSTYDTRPHLSIFVFFFEFLFIFGCAGSLTLCGLSDSCSTWASPCDGFSLCRARALRSVGFSSCSSWALLEHRLNVVVPGLSCAMACGIFLDQRLNQCL